MAIVCSTFAVSLPVVLVVDPEPFVSGVIITSRGEQDVEADGVLAAEGHYVEEFVA